jgi:hypothetical protein
LEVRKMPRNQKKDDRKGAGSLFIPAGILIGFGVGFLIDNVPAGMFLGLGLGFLGFAITLLLKK